MQGNPFPGNSLSTVSSSERSRDEILVRIFDFRIKIQILVIASESRKKNDDGPTIEWRTAWRRDERRKKERERENVSINKPGDKSKNTYTERKRREESQAKGSRERASHAQEWVSILFSSLFHVRLLPPHTSLRCVYVSDSNSDAGLYFFFFKKNRAKKVEWEANVSFCLQFCSILCTLRAQIRFSSPSLFSLSLPGWYQLEMSFGTNFLPMDAVSVRQWKKGSKKRRGRRS